jgi:hypothetical protein
MNSAKPVIYIEIDDIITNWTECKTEQIESCVECAKLPQEEILKRMIANRFYHQCQVYSEGYLLYEQLVTLSETVYFEVQFLTTTYGVTVPDFVRELKQQKFKYINDREMFSHINFVDIEEDKKDYSFENCLLIDTNDSAISAYANSGGSSIKYTNAADTYELIKEWIEKTC